MLHTKDELQYFYNQLPKNLKVSNNVNLGIFETHKKQAYKYQWSASRQDNLYTRIIVDFDEDKAKTNIFDLIEDTSLYPNLIVKNPHNNSCHLHFRLENAVSTYKNSLSKPFDFYNAVRRSLSLKLECDTSFTGYIAKNPVFKGFFYDKKNDVKTTSKFRILSYNNKPWTLNHLADYLDLEQVIQRTRKKASTQTQQEQVVLRNCDTFKAVSLQAYAITHLYKETGNKDAFYSKILELVSIHQSCYENLETGALSISEQQSIAKSITNYCMNPANHIFVPTGRSSRNINFGRDELKTSFLTDLRDKQIVSATETNKQRKNDTERKIRSAIYSIKADSNKVTQKRISEVSGLGIATVKRHSKLIKSLK